MLKKLHDVFVMFVVSRWSIFVMFEIPLWGFLFPPSLPTSFLVSTCLLCLMVYYKAIITFNMALRKTF